MADIIKFNRKNSSKIDLFVVLR